MWRAAATTRKCVHCVFPRVSQINRSELNEGEGRNRVITSSWHFWTSPETCISLCLFLWCAETESHSPKTHQYILREWNASNLHAISVAEMTELKATIEATAETSERLNNGILVYVIWHRETTLGNYSSKHPISACNRSSYDDYDDGTHILFEN